VYARRVSYDRIDFVHPALDLVNSQHGIGRDLLEDAGWTSDFFARWGYKDARVPSARELGALVALRALMRRIVETVSSGGQPRPADVKGLNRILRGGRLEPVFEADGTDFTLRLAPATRDWPSVLSELAAALAELLSEGESERLKVCDNPDCRFAFYDASRNRSRRWCSHRACGNRHKVKQFRARRRRERSSASK
jgi:predicted RNA-binding Zn ribbon-like protein